MVDGLEDLDVEVLGLRRVEWKTKSQESISETLNTDGNGAVTEIALSRLRNWVVVDIDDLVQVLDNDLADFV
jgi:hypothetical protein